MLVLKPYAHHTIWGGDRLNKYLDEKSSGIGHLYTVRATVNDANEIINSCECMNLHEYFLKHKQEWNLQELEEFPISIALVDATQNLSVQVHPDREKAAKYETIATGKNESFYLLEEPDCGAMINGCKCVDKEELSQKVKMGKWDEVIDFLEVHKGDYVYVSAGTLHAMTKGALTYEIEENCQYTYRLYDYERVDSNGNKRPLDTEKALDCICIEKKSDVKECVYQEFVEEKYSTQMIRDFQGMENAGSKPVCITVLDGNCNVDGIKITPGMSIILEPNEQIKGIKIALVIVAKLL